MLLDDEIRIAHREETQNDKIIRDMAKSQALCWCKLEAGMCNDETDCPYCSQSENFNLCYEELSPYDQTRVDTASEFYYQQLTSTSFCTYKDNIKYFIMMFIYAIVVAAAIWWACGAVDKDIIPLSTPTVVNRIDYVKHCMRDYPNKAEVYNDGKEDCKDYAYFFKIVWDSLYTDKCQIVYVYKYDFARKCSDYHLMIFADNKLIEPAYYCYDDYTRYYIIHWLEINSWCSLDNYKITINKVRKWFYDYRIS